MYKIDMAEPESIDYDCIHHVFVLTEASKHALFLTLWRAICSLRNGALINFYFSAG